MSTPGISELTRLRATRPEAVLDAARRRRRRPLLSGGGRVLIIAADHPARGALGVAGRPLAMASRPDLLERLCVALERPGVDGVLATPDILEDLLLLGALEGKVVVGSMNRGGLAGAAFEMDDRFTAYRAADIERFRFDAGKLLLRIDESDPGSLATMAGAARAVTELAERGLTALVEPFMARRVGGRVRNDLSAAAVVRSAAIASGLGATSAYTWLKVPLTENAGDMARVAEATTLPLVLLGGDVPDDADATFDRWHQALRLPSVYGLVAGRTLLYPPGDDVAAAVDTAVRLL
ncbi:Cgl0159 family (beta/alpha)8-fold protein [Marinitenerispora sediminis]|uniref:Deoxyribose-phosphate aldolase n=1 Tax=Marinitenerispora sediminis TaxID=1931232 RepID=A0A368T1P8_9ACTN|nr:deoxyribose-phosphate aldolase [Marinitenerispora sediminis]RCV48424.1 deoxyribose-phosphate aldolase [Marinitenerispora sediminis]RCV49237.1 deoxyribose-phosphate aldolase [Marinitenerispora sediminis]RCV54349.1 deoxyribose-phosphate aldolase [Marinitenerispora sediminis]